MKYFFILAFFTLSISLSGAIYYVAIDGNDVNGNGSRNFPYYTLEKAWTFVSAGDTIYLKGGTYRYSTRQDLKGKDGKSGYRINIWGYPGEKPIITKSEDFDVPGQTQLVYIDADYIYIKDLEISYFEQNPGIKASSALFCLTSNSIFENINYHHNAMGMTIRGSSTKNLILNCDFHHNYDPYGRDPWDGSSYAYNDADGLDIAEIPSGSFNTVRGCRFYSNADDGLDLWYNDGSVVIDSCWAWMNGYREDGVSTGGDGAGFKLGQTVFSDYAVYKRFLTNNLSVSNRNFGITQNGAKCKMFISNNVLYGNQKMGIYFSSSWGDAPHLIRNNISYKNATDAAIGIKLPVVDHNSWQPGVTVTDEDFISIDTTQLVRLRKADGSLPEIGFMHLAAGSDLIDAGIDVGLPYWGEAPDMGAFEVVVGDYHLNELPVVTISSPTKGTNFVPPATVTVEVDAYDPDGSISKVELYNGSKKLAELTLAPYSFTLKDLPVGSYNLKAVAIDNLNASAVSAALEVSVVAYNEKSEYFNLYPNPNNGRFTVDFTSLVEADIFTVTIVDLIGNTVYREELSKEESTRQFDLSHLNSGVYVLMISANQILLTQKFIKG